MSKTAPIALTFILLFSAYGYMAIGSNTNDTDGLPSSTDFFICEDGEEISADLQNNGLEDCTDSSDEDVIDHTKHIHTAPQLEAILVEIEGDQFIAGNVIHDHPMEVRINWVMQSAEGNSSGDNMATDMNGAWSYDIEVEDRSENISITFRAHNLPEDTWSDNLTIVIETDEIDNGNSNDSGVDDSGNNTDGGNETGGTDNETGGTGNETGVNTPPQCDAGQDLTTEVNEIAYLDASNSVDPDGDVLQNPSWQILERPEDSTAMIQSSSDFIAEFTPDFIGYFTI